MPAPTGREHGNLGDRWRGALAGLVPVLAIAILFAASGSLPSVQTVGSGTGIAMTAGWLAGPLAGRSHRLLVGAIGYALALLATNGALSVIQAGWDASVTNGPDPLAIAAAGAERALYALVSTAYFIVPALVLGGGWVVAARGLARLASSRHVTPQTEPQDPAHPEGPPRASRSRRWAIGLTVGLVVGVGILVGGVLVGILGIAALLLLAKEPGRDAPIGGLMSGFGAAWLALFLSASAACREGCAEPDLTAWYVIAGTMLVIGSVLTIRAFLSSSTPA